MKMWENFLQNPMNLDMLKLSAPQLMPGAPAVPPAAPQAGGMDPAMFGMMARYGRPNTSSAQPQMNPAPSGPMPSAPSPTSFSGLSPFMPAPPAAPVAGGVAAQLSPQEYIRKYGGMFGATSDGSNFG